MVIRIPRWNIGGTDQKTFVWGQCVASWVCGLSVGVVADLWELQSTAIPNPFLDSTRMGLAVGWSSAGLPESVNC